MNPAQVTRKSRWPWFQICQVTALWFIVAIGVATNRGIASQAGDSAPSSSWIAGDESAIADGWIRLFDGESLRGWKAGSQANWEVVDGTIRVSEGEPGLLTTTSQFSDFELQAEVLAARDTNSGIFLRTSPVPTSPIGDCYELNIIRPELHQFATGSLVGRAVADLKVAQPDDENWLRVLARVENGSFRIWVNDQLALEHLESDQSDTSDRSDGGAPQPIRLGRGYIGLQFKEGPVAFRNITLRPLGLEEQIGTDWESRWDATRTGAAKAEWSADEQVLRLLGGSGQLESRQAWGDFVVQAKVRTDAAGVNSGLFYRCVHGSNMDGYEIQIDHTTVSADDPTPANAGTGAIFRRTTVDRLRSRDNEWFFLTAAVCGPHVSVWVNGEQVTDWTDTRAADSNARKGLRLDPGTLMLQGHDPESAISVASLTAKELRPRRASKRP